MKYIAIAAISENRAIGKDGKIPWYIPEDFKHFKETTLGSPIIMGRKTFESIGRPLPGRENIILSRKVGSIIKGMQTLEGKYFDSIEEITKYLLEKNIRQTFVCGGEQIYKEYLNRNIVDELIVSRIKINIEGADAFFPEFEKDFILEKTDERKEFTIEYWKKKL